MSLNPFNQPSVKDLVKDIYVKKTLAEKAIKAIRDVQMEALQSTEKELGPGDVANCFCEVIEAIFLHGLKNRLTRMKFSEMFGMIRVSKSLTSLNLPRPDFWTLVCNVTHRVGLETISRLDQVSTDVGRCRAWVRFAINDGTLTSSI
ncbi:pleckstrin homology domain-containing family M member 1-like, partial [Tropilaelaps mercedesae]